MKKLLLLLVCLPALSFGSVGYININDGYHMVNKGDTFSATEQITSSADTFKQITCNAWDAGKIAPIAVNWIITANDYFWHYSEESSGISTQSMLPPGNAVYKIVIQGRLVSTDTTPFGFIQCKTTT